MPEVVLDLLRVGPTPPGMTCSAGVVLLVAESELYSSIA